MNISSLENAKTSFLSSAVASVTTPQAESEANSHEGVEKSRSVAFEELKKYQELAQTHERVVKSHLQLYGRLGMLAKKCSYLKKKLLNSKGIAKNSFKKERDHIKHAHRTRIEGLEGENKELKALVELLKAQLEERK